MSPNTRILPLIAMALGLGGLGGCVVAAVGAAGTGAKAVSEDRSTGSQVDDSVIKINLDAKFIGDSFSLFNNVSTTVNEGRVLLTGSVKKPEYRIEAERLAWTVKGVREVNNEIQVEDQSGIWDGLRDTRICTEVRSDLTFDRDIHSQNYSLDCVNGIVYVSGIAKDKDELDRVKAHIKSISGVKDIVVYTRFKDEARTN
jgi:osmotically-inducible protein OsmY